MNDQDSGWRVKQAYLKIASELEASWIAKNAQRWEDTHDRGHLDNAVIYCEKRGLPILPELVALLATEIRRRKDGRLSRADKEHEKLMLLIGMAKMIVLADATLERAADAAAALSTKSPHPMKASSLEKYYTDEFRSGVPSLEEQVRHRLERARDLEEQRAHWRARLEKVPEPSDDQRGHRR